MQNGQRLKKWPLSLICILAGLGVGFAAAYDIEIAQFALSEPLLRLGHGRTNEAAWNFNEVAKLGADEQAAANCRGKSNVDSALLSERSLLLTLDESNDKTSSFRSLIEVAQLRLSIRKLIEPQKQLDLEKASPSDLAERATQLALSAGWRDPSETHFRAVITALDKDYCGQLPNGGAAAQ